MPGRQAPEMGPAIRYTLRRSTVIIMRIFNFDVTTVTVFVVLLSAFDLILCLEKALCKCAINYYCYYYYSKIIEESLT